MVGGGGRVDLGEACCISERQRFADGDDGLWGLSGGSRGQTVMI